MLNLSELKEQILQTPSIVLGVILLLVLIGWNILHHIVKRSSKTAPAVPYWAPFGTPTCCIQRFLADGDVCL